MATLKDLKPCIDDGNMALRITDGSSEFVEYTAGMYRYDCDGLVFERHPTFDALLSSLGEDDELLEMHAEFTDMAFVSQWDLLDVDEE